MVTAQVRLAQRPFPGAILWHQQLREGDSLQRFLGWAWSISRCLPSAHSYMNFLNVGVVVPHWQGFHVWTVRLGPQSREVASCLKKTVIFIGEEVQPQPRNIKGVGVLIIFSSNISPIFIEQLDTGRAATYGCASCILDKVLYPRDIIPMVAIIDLHVYCVDFLEDTRKVPWIRKSCSQVA